MSKIICFLLFGSLLFNSVASAQTLLYNVLIANKKSGTLTVQSTSTGDDATTIRSQANFSVAFQDINALLEVEYQNGHMHESSMIQKVNDKVREQTIITRQGTEYNVEKKGKEATILAKTVTYTVAMLYHTEPTGIKYVFSERYGVFCPLKKLDSNQYELEMPNGQKVQYFYEKGVCTKVLTRQMMMDVRFELQKKGIVQG